jgi:ubiquinone/menaquinone biosynthesis C-methylase UbiE/DNA-binding transcriptional ArsR family regulator
MNGHFDAAAMIEQRLSLAETVAALKAVGEETRLRLVHLLSHGELNVKDLTAILGQSQPRISRHLKLLDEAGLVRRHREGNWVYCRLADRGGAAAITGVILDQVACDGQALASDISRLQTLKRGQAAAAKRFFDDIAGEWDRVRGLQVGEGEVEGAIVAIAGEQRFGTMIDLGTGTGRMLELFADRIGHGIGIDISHTMLSHARTRLSMAGLGHCELRHGDITSLAQNENSADLVVLHQVLHYFDDPLPVLREAARVLKPDGQLLIVDFASHSVGFLRDELAHRRLGFSSAQIAGWFGEVGLSLVRSRDLKPAGNSARPRLTVSIWLSSKVSSGNLGTGTDERENAGRDAREIAA